MSNLTKEEIELLKKPFPKSPCLGCFSTLCNDCKERKQYQNQINQYIEKGLLDLASRIDFIRDFERRIERKREELNHFKLELPVEILNEVFKEEIK